MDYESLRARIVSCLQTGRANSLSAITAELTAGDPPDLCFTEEHRKGYLRDGVAVQISAILHEMLRCGILAPEFAWDQNSRSLYPPAKHLPLQVTDYGRRVLAGDADAVWDPVGFLDDLQQRVPELGEPERTYLDECVRAFHLSLYRASLVMLGGASEALVLKTIADTADALGSTAQLTKSLEEGRIFPAFRKWQGQLEAFTPKPPGMNEWLQSIVHTFEIIRRCRNEGAHPKTIQVDRLELQVLIVAFRRYARSLFDLRQHILQTQTGAAGTSGGVVQ